MENTQKPIETPLVVESTPKRKSGRRVRYDHNPFLEGVISTFGDKRVKVAMKPNLAEINNSTGEITLIPGEIVKVINADKESFVKLYTAQLDAFFDLSGCAKPVVKYLIHTHQQNANRHLVMLHRGFALQDGFDIPESTWFVGIKELIDKDFIAAAVAQNSYYLNPAIFFNGDRTKFVVEVRKQAQELMANDKNLEIGFDDVA